MKIDKTIPLLVLTAIAMFVVVVVLKGTSEPMDSASEADDSLSVTNGALQHDVQTSTGELTVQEQVLFSELQQDFTLEELSGIFNPPTLEELLRPTESGAADHFLTANFQYFRGWAEFVDNLNLSPEDARLVQDAWIESRARQNELAAELGRAVSGDGFHGDVSSLADAQTEVGNKLVSRLSQILSPEQMAAYFFHEERLIVENLAFLEAYQEEMIDKGHYGLISAADVNDLPTVLAYLESGADPNRLMADGEGAIHEAARNNNTQILRALIDAGADVNLADNGARSALMKAALFGSTDAVRVLIEAGADVEYLPDPDSPFSNALSDAAVNGHTEIVRELLDAGADATGSVGEFALVNAIEFGDSEMERMLIEAGAPVSGSMVDKSRLFISLGRRLGLVD